MKKITKTTERNWQCPYCNFLNDLSSNTCKNCGAVRNGNEVEKEIKALEKERIILGYNTLIDWNKAGTNKVTAVI